MDIKKIPYGHLKVIGSTLFATRGSCIDLLNISDGIFISSWKCPITHTTQSASISEIEPTVSTLKSSKGVFEFKNSSPVERRSFSYSEDCREDTTPKPENAKKKSNQNTICSIDTPNITVFTSSTSGKYLVLVTGEDKSIRVLEVIGTGQSTKLNQLSRRSMPKRPCGLIITKDDSTIISADKFGDVYSLPLLYSCPSPIIASITHNVEKIPEIFIPAANELTIHSQRNLRALECQRKQKKSNSHKSGIDFDHKLLLGHVSMITDIKLAYVNGRSYLITSDRDEHIRISRGIPQAHIIENFCLGHSEFVSRLCIPETRPNILISGGGDDEIFIWDWESGVILSKTKLGDYVTIVRRELYSMTKDVNTFKPQAKVAVSGILHISEVSYNQRLDIIIICSESIPAFFTFILSPENTLQYIETIWTSGNVLAMCVASEPSSTPSCLFVSIDHIHKRGSKSEMRKSDSSDVTPLYKLILNRGRLVGAPLATEIPSNDTDKNIHPIAGKLSDLIYGIENLRKGGDESPEK